MRTIYLDCGMGAAGDMLTAALLELTEDVPGSVSELNALGIPGVKYEIERSEKCGISGTHMHVLVNGVEEGEHEHHHEHEHEHHHEHHEHEHAHHHHHEHHSLADIDHIIDEHIHADENVKAGIRSVYKLIADAESSVHGHPIEEIHFHEVGSMDALADVAAVCYLLDKLKPERIIASPVHVGRGMVRCAHGILPVPAPATALILRGIPVYSVEEIEGELCTPTGAALLKHFVQEFKTLPAMNYSAIGYGMGRKDFPRANCVRAFLGELEDREEIVYELNCNLDDMTGEEIGFATEELLKAGAYEVFTTSVNMKKSRPGVLLTVIASKETKDELVRLIFKHSSTLGIRETRNSRYIMDRTVHDEDTIYGSVRRKFSEGYGVKKSKYEYEDIARIARERGESLREVRKGLN